MNRKERPLVRHWSGRKRRDLARSIPKQTEAMIVVLDRLSHALARKIRSEAASRGLAYPLPEAGARESHQRQAGRPGTVAGGSARVT